MMLNKKGVATGISIMTRVISFLVIIFVIIIFILYCNSEKKEHKDKTDFLVSAVILDEFWMDFISQNVDGRDMPDILSDFYQRKGNSVFLEKQIILGISNTIKKYVPESISSYTYFLENQNPVRNRIYISLCLGMESKFSYKKNLALLNSIGLFSNRNILKKVSDKDFEVFIKISLKGEKLC